MSPVYCRAADDVKSAAAEYPVKAAYIYNFVKFIEWPPALEGVQPGRIVIGVWGEGEQVRALKDLNGKSAKGKVIEVRQVSSRDQLTSCQVLFICASEEKQLKHILHQCNTLPILTISSLPGFAETGGDIGFFLADNKVRFSINLEATKQAGLAISARLLALARIVTTAQK